MYDVIIIGAGPAGSIAGYFLSLAGVSCIILDRQKFPRNKPCGGAITRRAIEMFPFISPLMEFPNFKQIYHHKDQIEQIGLESQEPIMFLNDRYTLDYELLQLALQNGCIFREEIRVIDVEQFPEKVVITTDKNEQIEGKFVIGADGAQSIVRRMTGLQRYWKKEDQAITFVLDINVDEGDLQGLFPNKKISHYHIGFGEMNGYGWVFPRLKNINIGFGARKANLDAKQIRSAFNSYLVYCENNKLIPQLQTWKPLSWIVPIAGPLKKFSIGRIILAGDAAGFVHPITGEGIIYAMWSGKLAAETLTRYFNNTIKYEKVDKIYHSLCMKKFGNDLKLTYRFQGIGIKEMGLIFQLAQEDRKLYDILKLVLPGETPFRLILPRLLWRVFLGLLRRKFKRHKIVKKEV